jgi:hypothetical protein
MSVLGAVLTYGIVWFTAYAATSPYLKVLSAS